MLRKNRVNREKYGYKMVPANPGYVIICVIYLPGKSVG